MAGMKLVSLELSPQEAKAETIEARETEKPKYPYGTCLYLDEEALAKLGVKELPDVGSMLHIMAVGKVTGTSEREYEGGSHKTLDVQIVEMACEEADAEGDNDGDESLTSPAAKKLYGGKSED
jgi:hypothetical protein